MVVESGLEIIVLDPENNLDLDLQFLHLTNLYTDHLLYIRYERNESSKTA